MLLFKNKDISEESLRTTDAPLIIPSGKKGTKCSIDINGTARVTNSSKHGQDSVKLVELALVIGDASPDVILWY